jgi:hypothetical protein
MSGIKLPLIGLACVVTLGLCLIFYMFTRRLLSERHSADDNSGIGMLPFRTWIVLVSPWILLPIAFVLPLIVQDQVLSSKQMADSWLYLSATIGCVLNLISIWLLSRTEEKAKRWFPGEFPKQNASNLMLVIAFALLFTLVIAMFDYLRFVD